MDIWGYWCGNQRSKIRVGGIMAETKETVNAGKAKQRSVITQAESVADVQYNRKNVSQGTR